MLSEDVTLDSGITISKDITVIGNGNAFEGKPVTVNNANVTFKNVDFSTPTSTNKNASHVYISGTSEKVIFDGCTFSDPQWEAIQITANTMEDITITNCIFECGEVDTNANTYYGSTAGQIIRYIHIQPNVDEMPVINMTFTNNTFRNCDKVAGEIIGIYYVGEGSIVTIGRNTFEDVDAEAERICVGYPVNIEDLATPESWTGEVMSYTVPAQTQN